MDSSKRAELIREGNKSFNDGNYTQARQSYTKANYSAGLVRIGDHFMFDRRLPLLAYGYYKKANDTKKVKDLYRRMIGAIGTWIGQDKIKEESLTEFGMKPMKLPAKPHDDDGMIPVFVGPELRETALKILQGSSN